jgi:hypothetical protein
MLTAMDIDVEVPVLVIATGILLLLAGSPAIPAPSWLIKSAREPPGHHRVSEKSADSWRA